jgi:hypothetical protein
VESPGKPPRADKVANKLSLRVPLKLATREVDEVTAMMQKEIDDANESRDLVGLTPVVPDGAKSLKKLKDDPMNKTPRTRFREQRADWVNNPPKWKMRDKSPDMRHLRGWHQAFLIPWLKGSAGASKDSPADAEEEVGKGDELRRGPTQRKAIRDENSAERIRAELPQETERRERRKRSPSRKEPLEGPPNEALQRLKARLKQKMRMIQYGDDALDNLIRFGNEFLSGGDLLKNHKQQSRVHEYNVELTEHERVLRDAARRFDLDMQTAERIHQLFSEFDADGTGLLDFDEFELVVARLLKADAKDIPRARMLKFWQEIDQDGSGEVDFEEFVEYYIKYFGTKGADPASAIYSRLGTRRMTFVE